MCYYSVMFIAMAYIIKAVNNLDHITKKEGFSDNLTDCVTVKKNFYQKYGKKALLVLGSNTVLGIILYAFINGQKKEMVKIKETNKVLQNNLINKSKKLQAEINNLAEVPNHIQLEAHQLGVEVDQIRMITNHLEAAHQLGVEVDQIRMITNHLKEENHLEEKRLKKHLEVEGNRLRMVNNNLEEERLEEKVNQLKTGNRELETKNKELETENKELETKNNQLKKDKEVVKENSEVVKENNEAVEKKSEALRVENDQLEKEQNQLEKKNYQLKEDEYTLNNKLKTEILALTEEDVDYYRTNRSKIGIDTKEGGDIELKEEYKALEEEYKAQEEILRKKEGEIKELTTAITELQTVINQQSIKMKKLDNQIIDKKSKKTQIDKQKKSEEHFNPLKYYQSLEECEQVEELKEKVLRLKKEQKTTETVVQLKVESTELDITIYQIQRLKEIIKNRLAKLENLKKVYTKLLRTIEKNQE